MLAMQEALQLGAWRALGLGWQRGGLAAPALALGRGGGAWAGFLRAALRHAVHHLGTVHGILPRTNRKRKKAFRWAQWTLVPRGGRFVDAGQGCMRKEAV